MVILRFALQGLARDTPRQGKGGQCAGLVPGRKPQASAHPGARCCLLKDQWGNSPESCFQLPTSQPSAQTRCAHSRHVIRMMECAGHGGAGAEARAPCLAQGADTPQGRPFWKGGRNPDTSSGNTVRLLPVAMKMTALLRHATLLITKPQRRTIPWMSRPPFPTKHTFSKKPLHLILSYEQSLFQSQELRRVISCS